MVIFCKYKMIGDKKYWQFVLVILKAASFYYYTIFDHMTNIEILNKITKKALIMLELFLTIMGL